MMLVSCFFISSCDLKGDYRANYENKIFSKEGCIQEIKELFQVPEIRLFDYDFSNLENISIVDSSYNVSVLANMKYNEDKGRHVIDFDSQACVCLVVNYKVNYEGTCLGFSVYYDVLNPGGSGSKNVLFTKETFKSIRDLKPQSGDGCIYGSNNTIYEINVPKGFYSKDLSNCINPIIMFSKYSGSLYDIKIESTPIHVVTHYLSYDDFDLDCEKTSMMERVVSYMMSYTIYKCF